MPSEALAASASVIGDPTARSLRLRPSDRLRDGSSHFLGSDDGPLSRLTDCCSSVRKVRVSRTDLFLPRSLLLPRREGEQPVSFHGRLRGHGLGKYGVDVLRTQGTRLVVPPTRVSSEGRV